MPNKTKKRLKKQQRRGGEVGLPILSDVYNAAYISRMSTDRDRRQGIYSVYQKMVNMKQLLSRIFLRKKHYLRSLEKSMTTILTGLIESNFTNPFDQFWFDRNLVDEIQLIDLYTFEEGTHNQVKQGICDWVGSYLKQLYIIITAREKSLNTAHDFPDKQSLHEENPDIFIFKCNTVFPVITIQDINPENQQIISKIFGNLDGLTIMTRLMVNYNKIKDAFIRYNPFLHHSPQVEAFRDDSPPVEAFLHHIPQVEAIRVNSPPVEPIHDNSPPVEAIRVNAKTEGGTRKKRPSKKLKNTAFNYKIL